MLPQIPPAGGGGWRLGIGGGGDLPGKGADVCQYPYTKSMVASSMLYNAWRISHASLPQPQAKCMGSLTNGHQVHNSEVLVLRLQMDATIFVTAAPEPSWWETLAVIVSKTTVLKRHAPLSTQKILWGRFDLSSALPGGSPGPIGNWLHWINISLCNFLINPA